MKTRVAITGMGIVSAIGKNAEENFVALKNGKTGLSTSEILKTRHNNLPVGEIKTSNSDLKTELVIPENKVFTRAALLGAKAAKETLRSANILSAGGKISIKNQDFAFINGTSVGGMDFIESLYQDFPYLPKNHSSHEAQHPGFTTNSIAEYLKINGLVSTISTACSSGANALMMGAKLIQSGAKQQVLAGGTDCLSKFTLNGFNSLRILSEENCKAFDENRNGLNLGEAAAYLVLESETCANGKPILGYLSGFGNANDAHHQTASSETGEGAFLAMKQALKSANLQAKNVDYINAHGTATPNNDLSEGRAIERLFKNQELPPITSTKGFTGHTLAAAGAIEAVYALFSLEYQCGFPTLNFQTKMKELDFSPETVFKKHKIENVLSNSFGFGGNCTSLLFSKV